MQTRRQSALETGVSVAVGFAASLALQFALAHLYHLHAGPRENLEITVWFTILSLVRQYLLRRIFNRLHQPRLPRMSKGC